MEKGALAFEQLNAFVQGGTGKGGGKAGAVSPWWQGKGYSGGQDVGHPAVYGKAKGDKGKGKGKDGGKGGKGKGGKTLICHGCGGVGHPKRLCPSINNLEGRDQEDMFEPEQENLAGELEMEWMLNLQEEDQKCIRWHKTASRQSMTVRKAEAEGPCTQLCSGFHLLEEAVEELNQCVEQTNVDVKKWAKITAVVDSGAVDNVIPEDELPFVPMDPSERSKSGRGFRGPGGDHIPALGQKTVAVKTAEGQSRKTKWNVCPVKRALASVAKMNEAGNSVHLTAKSPHILNEKTGEKTAFWKEGNVYVMDLWVRIPDPPGVAKSKEWQAAMTNRAGRPKKVAWHSDVDMGNVSGFTRQGRRVAMTTMTIL